MLRVLAAVRTFHSQLPHMTEEALFEIGADVLRLTVDLYRRTGQKFLLEVLENLRSRLPDVSGVMHMFPFQTAYQPEKGVHSAQEQEYYDHMDRFATGTLTADSAAMTALISQYSGSGRDAAAAKAGLTALNRYHGTPAGNVADFTSFSFHAVKNFTTAEGGGLAWRKGIDSAEFYHQCMLWSLHGQSKDALSKSKAGAWEYDVMFPGYKSNMTDIAAAIGLVQLDRYPGMLARRRQMIERYAPPTENHTALYIETVCDLTGMLPDEQIDTRSRRVMVPIVSAMSRVENGCIARRMEVEEGFTLTGF
jgi:hypothetical protein